MVTESVAMPSNWNTSPVAATTAAAKAGSSKGMCLVTFLPPNTRLITKPSNSQTGPCPPAPSQKIQYPRQPPMAVSIPGTPVTPAHNSARGRGWGRFPRLAALSKKPPNK